MGRLYDLAGATLDLLTTDWPTDEAIALALPARQYVNAGDVIWDCEQLVVSVERTFGEVGDVTVEQFDSHTATMAVRAVTLAIWLIRCVPDLNEQGPPPAIDIELAAAATLADADAITGILAARTRLHEWAGCESAALENWQAQGPMGGFGGGVLRARVGLV